MDWHPIVFSKEEQAFMDYMQEEAHTLMQAFHIPPHQLGVTGESNHPVIVEIDLCQIEDEPMKEKTIEAVLVRYGTTPDPDGWIIWTRDVAISIAEQAKKTEKILSYRMEGDEKTGKIIATIESKDGYKMVGTSNQIDTIIWQQQHKDATAPTRDTQFTGFARALVDELRKVQQSSTTLQSEKIIAQRAYDLTQHAVGYTLEYLHECGLRTPGSMNLSIQPSIPDMTVLPEVE